VVWTGLLRQGGPCEEYSDQKKRSTTHVFPLACETPSLAFESSGSILNTSQ
jgi:hypothetical protein